MTSKLYSPVHGQSKHTRIGYAPLRSLFPEKGSAPQCLADGGDALLTLTPLIPGLLYVRDCLRFIRGMDELQRRIQMEAWLFAALGSLIIGTIINTLNAQGVSLGGLAHGLSLWGTFALTFVLWLVGTALANCRYK